jgi:hypothetical protein
MIRAVEAIRGSWAIDEFEHAGGEHLDPGYVAGYDLTAGFDPTEDVESLRRRGLASIRREGLGDGGWG